MKPRFQLQHLHDTYYEIVQQETDRQMQYYLKQQRNYASRH